MISPADPGLTNPAPHDISVFSSIAALASKKSKDLAGAIGITENNLLLIKTGKVKGLRLATQDAICRKLDCQPGDILEYKEG